MKDSKEFKEMIDAIWNWVQKYKGQVSFIADFCAYKGKDFKVVDDRMFAFGPKEVLELQLESLGNELDKEKKEFVNW